MNYADARTALHEVATRHRNVSLEHAAARDRIADEVRGTKASMSEADKRAVQQRMIAEHFNLVIALEQAEREKAIAEYQFDIADNAAKDARRECEAATACILQNVAQLNYDAAQINLQAARLTAEKEQVI